MCVNTGVCMVYYTVSCNDCEFKSRCKEDFHKDNNWEWKQENR